MSRKLVACFSAGGVTAKLAKRIADSIGADYFEILPQKPYTAADLDWTNGKSRSSVEMKNKSFRPEIANKVDNMASYDTVFIGFPIWWYVAPTIVNTFLESYDLKGKTVVPFATSGSSGIGKSADELRPSCKDATVLSGRLFAAGTSADELKSWAQQYL